MFQGQLLGIFVSGRKSIESHFLERVEVVAGRGLVGDRYFRKEGTFSKKDGPDREVTLIETEALEALERDYHITLEPAQARRNLLTRAVPLNNREGQSPPGQHPCNGFMLNGRPYSAEGAGGRLRPLFGPDFAQTSPPGMVRGWTVGPLLLTLFLAIGRIGRSPN